MFKISILSNSQYSQIVFTSSTRAGGSSSTAQSVFYRENYSVVSRKYLDRRRLEILAGFAASDESKSSFSKSSGIPRKNFEESKKSKTEKVQRKRGDGTFTRDAMFAARRRLNELLICSVCRNLKFITLTENEENKSMSFEEALKKVQNFERRLKRFCASKRTASGEKYPEVKSIFIPELGGKNGRLHWHVIAIMPYISKKVLAEKIWGFGFVDVKSLKLKKEKDIAKQISNYVSKYVTKEMRAIPGRKMIYYGAKNWKVTKQRAVLSNPQARYLFNAMIKMEDEKRIETGFWSFCNYRFGETDKFECEKWRARRRLPSSSELAPSDVIKITWTIPKKYCDSFSSFLRALNLQIEIVGIIGKTAEQKVCEERRKAQAKCFIRCRESDVDVVEEVKKLAQYFPHVDIAYIYAVLNYISRAGNDEAVINNFDALEYFHKIFNPLDKKIPPFLKDILYIRLPKKRYVPLDETFRFMRKFRYCEA